MDQLKPQTIVSGFKATGLCPWNPDQIDFTKCVGKKTNNAGDMENLNDINPESEKSISYSKFEEIIGNGFVRKFKALAAANITVDDDDKTSNLLYQVFRAFKVPTSMDEEATVTRHMNAPTDEDIPVTDGNIDILLDESVNFSEVEIFNMPLIIADEYVPETLLPQILPTSSGELPVAQSSPVSSNKISLPPGTPVDYDEVQPVLEPLKNASVSQASTPEKILTTSNLQNSSPETNLNNCEKNCTKITDEDSISDFLVFPKTPERKGKRDSKRMPYVITCSGFKKICEEKENLKKTEERRKETNRAKRAEKASIKTKAKGPKVKKSNASKEATVIEQKKGKIKNATTHQSPWHQDSTCVMTGSSNISEKGKDVQHVRNLFKTEFEEASRVSEKQNSHNVIVYNGLCFICVTNIYRTNAGIKCQKCKRTYHKACLERNDMYTEFFICPTCVKIVSS